MVAVKAISDDVKLAAIKLYDRRLLDLPTILSVVGFSRPTFYRALTLYRNTGCPSRPKSYRRGRPRLVMRDDIAYILALLRLRPDWFLDGLLKLLRHNRFLSIHFTTIFRELRRVGVSHKKLKKIAAERNEPVRMDFIWRMAKYETRQLGFIDETSKDERTVTPNYGWSFVGTRAVVKRKFVRATRVTGTGLLTEDGMLATRVIVGSMKKVDFVHFLEHNVMPLTSPYPGPLSVLVMDNAKIHHGQEIRDLAERFGVRIEYLPAYSPDLNPIEEAFAQIKAFIRHNWDVFQLKKGGAGLYDMQVAMEIVSAQDARSYFAHAGYI